MILAAMLDAEPALMMPVDFRLAMPSFQPPFTPPTGQPPPASSDAPLPFLLLRLAAPDVDAELSFFVSFYALTEMLLTDMFMPDGATPYATWFCFSITLMPPDDIPELSIIFHYILLSPTGR